MSESNFLDYCLSNDLVNAKLLYTNKLVSVTDINNAINKSSKNLTVVPWLCSLPEANYGNIVILFVSSCGVGNIELVKVMLPIIDNEYIIKCGLIIACQYDQFEIMKLLYGRNLDLHKKAYFQTVSGSDTKNIIDSGYEVFTGRHSSTDSHYGSVYTELLQLAKNKKSVDMVNWLESIN